MVELYGEILSGNKKVCIACMCIQKPNANIYSEKGRRRGKREMARIENGGIVW